MTSGVEFPENDSSQLHSGLAGLAPPTLRDKASASLVSQLKFDCQPTCQPKTLSDLFR